MASESETSAPTESPRSILRRLINSRNRDLSLLIPFILGFNTSITDPDDTRVESPESTPDPDDNSGNRPSPDVSTQREMIRDLSLLNPLILGFTTSITDPDDTRVESPVSTINPDDNPANRSSPDESSRRGSIMVMIIGGEQSKSGHPPAARSAVEAMTRVEIREGDEEERGECVICLEEYRVGSVMKKMPCEHGFHEVCIEKWLGIHGSCPVCRYKMPVDDEERSNKSEERESGGDDGGRVNREIWVRISFGGGRRRGINDQNSVDADPDPTVENEPVLHMED